MVRINLLELWKLTEGLLTASEHLFKKKGGHNETVSFQALSFTPVSSPTPKLRVLKVTACILSSGKNRTDLIHKELSLFDLSGGSLENWFERLDFISLDSELTAKDPTRGHLSKKKKKLQAYILVRAAWGDK